MRTLFHHPLCPFSRKVRVVLKEKNLDFELMPERVWERRPEYLAMNPAAEVPVMVEPDGKVIVDSGVICEYLEEVYRDRLLMGIDPVDRAEIRRLVAWFDLKMNREVTLNLVGEKMMKRMMGYGNPNSWSSAGAGWPAIISRWPILRRRPISRRWIISATCPGPATSRPRIGMRASSLARPSDRC